MSDKVRRIIWLQVLISAAISLPLLALYGVSVGLSAFAGGAIGFSTSLAYAWAMSVRPGSDPKVLMRAHWRAEFMKLGLTVVLFAGVLVLWKGVAPLPMLLTFTATLFAFWAALLMK
jgi:ATP synthase protein I